jgi:hypothetical protein
MGADNAGLRIAVIGMGQRSAIARHVAPRPAGTAVTTSTRTPWW